LKKKAHPRENPGYAYDTPTTPSMAAGHNQKWLNITKEYCFDLGILYMKPYD